MPDATLTTPATHPRYKGGVSPYGKKAQIKHWTAAEKKELVAKIEEIVTRICNKYGIHFTQVYGRARGKRRDACRVEAIQTVSRELNVAPAIVARVFCCHQRTVMQALNGKRRKPNLSRAAIPASNGQ